MSKWFPILVLFFTSSLMINVVIKDKFDDLTGYKDWQFHSLPTWFILIFIFFGVFMFPFYKLIREYRKTFYIKQEIRIYERHERMFRQAGMNKDRHDRDYEDYIMNKRYLKLKKLQKNSKRIWTYFHI